ncbi:MAG: YcnI family protein [Aeromicrobium sp.]|uniref:YcnI family copper-binding membrane protein n=1 Tax=Aeromicrobium sp. TaxID=1871063 RepID=UPI0039E6A4C8
MRISAALTRLGAAGALGLGTALAPLAGASAHVTVTPSTTESGGYAVLTFSVGHGCDGSPTTQVSIAIPGGVYSVTPTRHPDYTVEKVMETLDEPVDDGHGGQYTERVAEVVYTATTPLPDGYRDAFELQLRLPEGEAGEVVAFPTIQTCAAGETAWIDEVVEGEPEPESPAPSFTLTAAGGEDDASPAEESDATSPLVWVAVALGALGALLGGAAFVRSGRSS